MAPKFLAYAQSFLKLAKKINYSSGILYYCPEDGTVFLTKRSDTMNNPNLWDIPGGRSNNEDQDILHTAKREATEELNILPENTKLLTRYTIQKKNKDKHNKFYKYYVFVYAISQDEKEKWEPKIKLDKENSNFNWFSISSLPDNLRYDLSWLPDVLSEKGTIKMANLHQSEFTLPRSEFKYLVPETLIPEMREYLEPYVSPDEHGRIYHIKNIYFDTSDLKFFKDHLQKDDRFKLRARKYNTSDDIFLEIKRKHNKHIIKRRNKVEQGNYPHMLGQESELKFIQLLQEYRAKPVAVIEYSREAYFLKEDPTTRITFDRQLRYSPTKFANIEQQAKQSLMPNATVILELKFYNEMPEKIKKFVKKFDLERRPVSKYINAVIEMLYSSDNQLNLTVETLSELFNLLVNIQKKRKLI